MSSLKRRLAAKLSTLMPKTCVFVCSKSGARSPTFNCVCGAAGCCAPACAPPVELATLAPAVLAADGAGRWHDRLQTESPTSSGAAIENLFIKTSLTSYLPPWHVADGSLRMLVL